MTDKLEESYKNLLISAGENPEREGEIKIKVQVLRFQDF